MKRFEKFLNRKIDESLLSDDAYLDQLGIEKRYIPDEIDIFDELEFGLGLWQDKQLVFTFVLEHQKLARISIGYFPPDGDEDDVLALSPADLKELLEEKGNLLIKFFEKLFPG